MGENRKIYAALLGAGTVGSGVYKLAGMQEEDICLKTGAQLEIKKILVRNPGKVREGIPQELFTDSWQEILEDPEIQIVIEVMGGIEPARTYVEEAMKAGKQVVTANKDLLAEYGDPLFEIATENKCDLQFEAAVAGAIPIIRPLRQSLAGSQLTEIMGIVNGTTNYIFDQKCPRKVWGIKKLWIWLRDWAMRKQIPQQTWKAMMRDARSPLWHPSLSAPA